MGQTWGGLCLYLQWVYLTCIYLALTLLTVKWLTSPSGLSCFRTVIEFRCDMLKMRRAASPAVQQNCRVNLQQVPALRPYGKSWAGHWVWHVPCVTPPGICPAACVLLRMPLPATWGTTHKTIHYCMSYWAWACPCCLFYKRYCYRCTPRLCRMGPACYSLCCSGCRSKLSTGSSSSSAEPC